VNNKKPHQNFDVVFYFRQDIKLLAPNIIKGKQNKHIRGYEDASS